MLWKFNIKFLKFFLQGKVYYKTLKSNFQRCEPAESKSGLFSAFSQKPVWLSTKFLVAQ